MSHSLAARLLVASLCCLSLACGPDRPGPGDGGDGPGTSDGGTDAGTADAGQQNDKGAPGAACEDDSDCAGNAAALCYRGARGGYCLVTGCTVGTNRGCPDDSVCMNFDEETTACFEGPCDGDDSNCLRRGDGYSCMEFEQGEICWNFDYAVQNPGGDAIGAACEDGDSCESGDCFPEELDDGSLTGFQDGYCTFGCDEATSTPCPGGATCVGGLCLDDCGAGDTCRDGYVCTGGTCQRDISSVPLGAACDDAETCGFGACLTEEDPDWGVVVTGFPGGYCTFVDTCEVGTTGSCGPNGTCVETAVGGTLCAKSCTEPANCREGYDCIDGACLRPPSTLANVNLGAACTTDTDCDSVAGANGHCAKEGGEAYFTGGYCMSFGCTPADAEAGTPDTCAVGGGRCFILSEYAVGAFCIKSCTASAECREDDGYTCDDDDTCWPG